MLKAKPYEKMSIIDKDIGDALEKVCELDCDNELVHLARSVQIVRRYMFEQANSFHSSFKEACQEKALPPVLLTLVNMVQHGSTINDESAINASSTQAGLSIAQLLKFNNVGLLAAK